MVKLELTLVSGLKASNDASNPQIKGKQVKDGSHNGLTGENVSALLRIHCILEPMLPVDLHPVVLQGFQTWNMREINMHTSVRSGGGGRPPSKSQFLLQQGGRPPPQILADRPPRNFFFCVRL